jgi:hypothetical protein
LPSRNNSPMSVLVLSMESASGFML